ncbi:MAG: CHAT domain-containing protein [Planctomycetota bacterium]
MNQDRDEPSLDELIAFAEDRLLPAERARIAAFLAANPETASFLAEFTAGSTAGTVPTSAPLEAMKARTAVTPHPRWLRIAAAALILAAISAAYWFVTSQEATHVVDVAFARATQFAVLGDASGTQRGGDGEARPGESDVARIVARPSAELTISVVVPGAAHAWFLAIDSSARTVETLVDTAIRSDGDRLAVGRVTAPSTVGPDQRWVVMLVAQRPFDSAARERLQRAVRTAGDARSLRTALVREFGCVVDVRELVVAAEPPRKVGALDRRITPEQRELQARLVAVISSPQRDASTIAALRSDAAGAVADAVAEHGAKHEATLRIRHFAARLELTLGDSPDAVLLALDSLATDVRDAGLAASQLGASIESDLAGACRRLGQNETALRHAREALAIYERIEADRRVIAESLRGLADLHRELGDAEDARAHGDAAAALLAGTPSTDDVRERLLNLHLSRASTELRFAAKSGDLDDAARHVESARAWLDRMPGHAREATVLAYEIEVAKRRGDRASVLAKLEELRAHDRSRHGEEHPLTAMSDALLAREWIVDRRWQEARALLESALSRLEHRLLDLADARDRVTMAGSFELDSLIDDLVDCCLEADDRAAALWTLERGRSFAWRAWCTRAALEDTDLASLRTIRRDKSVVHLQLAVLERNPRALPSADIAALRRRLVELHHAETNEERRLARRLHVADHGADWSAASVFARAVDRGRGVAWFERGRSELRLFWLESTDREPRIEVVELAADAAELRDLDGLLEECGRAWCDPAVGLSALRAQLESLRARLLPPAVLARWSVMRSIAIVVDGPLASLPFEAIVENSPPLTYVPSLAANGRAVRRNAEAAVRRVLIAGFGAHQPRDPLQREAAILAVDESPKIGARTSRAALPEVAVEIDLLDGIWRERGATVNTLRGEEATVAAILHAACEHDVIHIAGHGRRADPALPYSAGSQLAPSEDAPWAAGLLNAKAVLLGWCADQSPVRCVVLAACDSGRAAETRFATLTLPSALLARGVDSVVASPHPVDSESTVQWMAALHAALAARRDGDALLAVHEAQSRLRERFGDPRIYAAFQHHGPGMASR